MFTIEQLDAMTGLAVLKELLTQSLPVDLLRQAGLGGLGGIIGGDKKEQSFDKSVESFRSLELKFLKNIRESIGGNFTPILRADGVFQVPELGMDEVLELLVHSVIHNYKDFFTKVLGRMGMSIPQGVVNPFETIQDSEN